MKRNVWRKRLTAVGLALALLWGLAVSAGSTAASTVYFTAANDQVLPLTADTMPFWSDGVLYVSSRIFEGTDLGVTYVRISSVGLTMLYTGEADLRFDLEKQRISDKQGNVYDGYAVERDGVVFFPLTLVCEYFGLAWSYNSTKRGRLIRVCSDSAILTDADFIDAATTLLDSRYAEYQRSLPQETPQTPTRPNQPSARPTPDPPENQEPPLQAADGQKVYLIVESVTAEDTLAVMERLEGVQATFLLPVEVMEDGDLLRGLVSGGHGVALLARGETAEEVEEELERAEALLRQAACAWLELVWYEGGADVDELLEQNCRVRVSATLDRRGTGLDSAGRADALLRSIGQYRSDVSVFLGGDSGCLPGLDSLREGLEEAGFRLCAWRLTTEVL